jgi:LemA protein
MSVVSIVIVVVLVAGVIWAINAYNQLVLLKNEISNSFGQIDVQLKRRYDLIPNLVEVAKKYLSHERSTLEAVITARNRASNATDALRQTPNRGVAINALTQAEGVLGGQLSQFIALNERYPDLKADQRLRELHEELTSTENRVGFARQAYNDSIWAYNTQAQQFPTLILAQLFGFAPLPMLQATESPEERKTVRISLQG